MNYESLVVVLEGVIIVLLLVVALTVISMDERLERDARNPVLIDCRYKEKYEELEGRLLVIIEEANEMREDFTQHDLTVSMIESEGHMRCAIQVKYILDDLKE
jgi:hypothetical protein